MTLLEPGVCAATGLPWTLLPTVRFRTNPWKPSLDRIHSDIGYVLGNVRVVVWAFNQAKYDWPEDVFKRIADAYIREARRA